MLRYAHYDKDDKCHEFAYFYFKDHYLDEYKKAIARYIETALLNKKVGDFNQKLEQSVSPSLFRFAGR